MAVAIEGGGVQSCLAPFVSLRFAPTGVVTACGPNWERPLGDVRTRSLLDIWHGPEAERLRAAVARSDFTHGCQECGIEIAAGDRQLTHAAIYDRFADDQPTGWPRRIEFGLSNTCNLQCVQCNGDLSSAIRSQREHRAPLPAVYGDAFFDQLRAFLPHVEVATFIGGEPFLARECRRVWDLMSELGVRPAVHVTTNGTVWDDRVEHYLTTFRMDLSVSIDGTSAATMNAIRVGSDHDHVRANLDRMLATTATYGGQVGVNFCILRQNWHEFGPLLLEADRLGLPVHAIRVAYPTSMSLYGLSAQELRPIVTSLGESDADLSERLDLNRDIWTDTLAHFADVLAGVEADEVAVSIDRPTGTTFAAVEAISRRLDEWAGQPSVRVAAIDGKVEHVGAPPWAKHLAADAWVGTDIDALMVAVERSFGRGLGTPVTEADDDALWWTFDLTGDDPLTLRVGLATWETGRHRHIELALNTSGASRG